MTAQRTWRTWQLGVAAAAALVLGAAVGATWGESDDPQSLISGPAKTRGATGSGRSLADSDTVLPSTTATPATTVARATNPPTTTTAGRVRTRPLPLGSEGILVDPPWTISVVDVTPNANAIVQRENRFNDPPADGHQFFMVRIRMTYRGQDSEGPLSVDLEAVGANNVVYRDSCGVIPDDYERANRAFAGGTVEGNVCWSIRSTDADSLVMIGHRLFGDRDVLYFALR